MGNDKKVTKMNWLMLILGLILVVLVLLGPADLHYLNKEYRLERKQCEIEKKIMKIEEALEQNWFIQEEDRLMLQEIRDGLKEKMKEIEAEIIVVRKEKLAKIIQEKIETERDKRLKEERPQKLWP